MKNGQVSKTLERLDKANAERASLTHQLRKSLAIQELWPDAFEHGSCVSVVTGNVHVGFTFTLTFDNGDTTTKPLEDVPTILWPEKIKADVRRLGLFSANKYYKILRGEKNE